MCRRRGSEGTDDGRGRRRGVVDVGVIALMEKVVVVCVAVEESG